jgi:hypothetical protein
VIAPHRVGSLPDEPLKAAAEFYADVLPGIVASLENQGAGVVLVFEPADYTHRGWRLAAVQQLARDHAPLRVNAIASDDDRAIGAAMAYLRAAEGVTGQYLPLDGKGAVGLLSESQ